MTHQYFNGVFSLTGWGTMKVLAKCRFNAWSVFKKLLKKEAASVAISEQQYYLNLLLGLVSMSCLLALA